MPPADYVLDWDQAPIDTVLAIFLIHAGTEFYAELAEDGHITDDCRLHLDVLSKTDPQTPVGTKVFRFAKFLKYNKIAATSIYAMLEQSLQDAIDEFFAEDEPEESAQVIDIKRYY